MQFILDFFSNDASKNWSRLPGLQLTFHLASLSLNGIAIDDPFEKISIFGRPFNKKPFEQQRFYYPDLGLEIGGENNRVKYFSFSMETFSANERACALNFISERGTQLYLTQNTKFSEVKSVLGEPVESEIFGDDVTHRFNFRQIVISFDFNETNLPCLEDGGEDFV